jgi:hypothetical protein
VIKGKYISELIVLGIHFTHRSVYEDYFLVTERYTAPSTNMSTENIPIMGKGVIETLIEINAQNTMKQFDYFLSPQTVHYLFLIVNY